jgi:hypothetical protein
MPAAAVNLSFLAFKSAFTSSFAAYKNLSNESLVNCTVPSCKSIAPSKIYGNAAPTLAISSPASI